MGKQSLLIDAELPNVFWAGAVHTSVYFMNRLPSRSINKTPEEQWSNKKPTVKHVRIFSCLAFAHIPSQKKKEFVENKKASTLLEKKKEETVKKRDLFCFLEQEPTAQTRKDFEKIDLEERNKIDISEPKNRSSNGYVDVNQNDSDFLPEIELREENAPPVPRNQRVRREPEAMKDYVTYSAMVEAVGDPSTV
ncbi:hypothetical protein JTB14_026673 [Gonioctena quinquepunctata]|nr:hypothetical protein JTB14_026673 [Gonioctena quinquepunctata]